MRHDRDGASCVALSSWMSDRVKADNGDGMEGESGGHGRGQAG